MVKELPDRDSLISALLSLVSNPACSAAPRLATLQLMAELLTEVACYFVVVVAVAVVVVFVVVVVVATTFSILCILSP